MYIRPDPRPDTAGRSGRGPTPDPVMPGQWHDPVRPPTISRPVVWATIVTIGAITASLLTLTSSEARTPQAGPTPGASTHAPTGTASSPANQSIIEFDFEQGDGDRPLDGWSGAGTATLTVDDSVAFHGERSLLVHPDGPRDRRYVEARVSLADIVDGRPLRGAQMTCRLRPGDARHAPDVRAGLVVEDRTTGADFGSEVPLRVVDDEWLALSLTVGDRGEPGVDGGTVYQSPQFDDTEVVSLAVYLEAPTGALASPVHVDACVIDVAGEVEPTRGDRVAPTAPDRDLDEDVYVPSLPPIPAPAPTPVAPETEEREPADDTAAGDPAADPVTDEPSSPVGGEVLLHDFEDPDGVLDQVAVEGTAVLSIDDTAANSGERSLRITPDPAGDGTSVETLLALAGRVPAVALDGARISCHVRPDAQVIAAGAYAVLIVEDARGDQDQGGAVALRDSGRWTELSLVIGERGEPARDGGIAPQSESFDAGALAMLRVRVAADVALTAPINLDDCTITAA